MDNLKEILELDWDSDSREIIERVINHFKSWRKFVPRSLENDIIKIIEIAVVEKKKIKELEALLQNNNIEVTSMVLQSGDTN